jgi:hypothetical protein
LQSARYFCPIFAKCEISPHICIRVSSTKFHGNPSSESCADTFRWVDGRTDVLDANRCVSRQCERAQVLTTFRWLRLPVCLSVVFSRIRMGVSRCAELLYICPVAPVLMNIELFWDGTSYRRFGVV